MNDIIQHLVEDLDWRLKPAGKAYKPVDKELTSWGSGRLGCIPAVLMWMAMMTIYIGLVGSLPIDVEILVPLASVIGLALCFVFGRVAGELNRRWQRYLDKQAYSKLLNSNERFMLVEYSKYLARKIHQAQRDRSLGGPQEIQRLGELRIKIDDMLRRSQPVRQGGQSQLSREAALAEAVLETYGHEQADPLQKLDERLPADVRARLAEQDKTMAQAVATTQAAAQSSVKSPESGEMTRPGPGTQAQPAAAQPAAPEIITELPRWAQELTQAIESLDLGSFLSETDAARQKGRGKETR